MTELKFEEIVDETLNQIRETLFNWLKDDLINAVCVDLFCGSGALGTAIAVSMGR